MLRQVQVRDARIKPIQGPPKILSGAAKALRNGPEQVPLRQRQRLAEKQPSQRRLLADLNQIPVVSQLRFRSPFRRRQRPIVQGSQAFDQKKALIVNRRAHLPFDVPIERPEFLDQSVQGLLDGQSPGRGRIDFLQQGSEADQAGFQHFGLAVQGGTGADLFHQGHERIPLAQHLLRNSLVLSRSRRRGHACRAVDQGGALARDLHRLTQVGNALSGQARLVAHDLSEKVVGDKAGDDDQKDAAQQAAVNLRADAEAVLFQTLRPLFGQRRRQLRRCRSAAFRGVAHRLTILAAGTTRPRSSITVRYTWSEPWLSIGP